MNITGRSKKKGNFTRTPTCRSKAMSEEALSSFGRISHPSSTSVKMAPCPVVPTKECRDHCCNNSVFVVGMRIFRSLFLCLFSLALAEFIYAMSNSSQFSDMLVSRPRDCFAYACNDYQSSIAVKMAPYPVFPIRNNSGCTTFTPFSRTLLL
jgi:hypothetical protein